jgi:hypothetical protein
MARIKYKIGTFVKVAETQDDPAHYGAIEEVRLTKDGTQYKVTGLDDSVEEVEIAAAYRAITPRKPVKTTKTKSKLTQARTAA